MHSVLLKYMIIHINTFTHFTSVPFLTVPTAAPPPHSKVSTPARQWCA